MSVAAAHELLLRLNLPAQARSVLEAAPSYVIAESRDELAELALGNTEADRFEVAYDVPGRGRYVEAEVVRCKNGLAVNYTEAYMRRRDPDCMVIADDLPTDKKRFSDRFDEPFESLREDIRNWLSAQEDLITSNIDVAARDTSIRSDQAGEWTTWLPLVCVQFMPMAFVTIGILNSFWRRKFA